MGMKKKRYLEEICHNLALYQKEMKYGNAADLYDNNKLCEDLVCGLLNLIYGYDLTNVNHVINNVPAIDLADSQRRIAVQVTTECTYKKVQDTVDMFIKQEFYKKYDLLWVVFVGDIPKFEKPIRTQNLIIFEKKKNVLNMETLMCEIKKLNTEKIEAIRNYLKKELECYDEGYNIWIKYLVTGCVFIAIVFVGYCSVSRLYMNTPHANVYYSKVLPYNVAGYYESYEDVSSITKMESETEKAFSILSFIRRDGIKDSMVEEVYCDILQLDPIEDAVIQLDAEIIDNKWKLYAINNGWGNSQRLKLENVTLHQSSSGKEAQLDSITSDKNIRENDGIASAKAVLLAEYNLDVNKFQELYKMNDEDQYITISAEVSCGEENYDWTAYLHYSNGKFSLSYGGADDGHPVILLFAVLDVDNKPQRISFTEPDSTPVVGETLRVETVIAPTKSCRIKCKNVFVINGKQQQTEIYTVKVNVPVFEKGAVGYTGMLTQELAQTDVFDEELSDQITQKYLYNPESIRNDYQISS